MPVFTGAHFLLYSRDADADREFLRDVLQLKSVDAGDGWLNLALPPTQLGVHPDGDNTRRRALRKVRGPDLAKRRQARFLSAISPHSC